MHFQYGGKILRFKFDIGDLVTFQKPNMTFEEWKAIDDYPYLIGMITYRDKAGGERCNVGHVSGSRHSYYHITLPDGHVYYSQREDRLALLAKAHP
tara:strand:+ start:4330 stop:4617 length:288 start_codon:yes stop_codon:yes gene_type:complete